MRKRGKLIMKLTENEIKKIDEITQRLVGMSSPVLRLQAILQFSQIVDILSIGDTSVLDRSREWEYITEIDELQERISELTEKQESERREI